MSRAYFDDATIVAIITSPNAVSSVGVIRVSGEGALSVATAVCELSRTTSDHIKPNYLYRCKVKDRAGRRIDDGMFVYMKAPRSFTGEDVVEIQLHGNPLILNRTVDALVKSGRARPAERGEFSFRAFKNGKIDLSQAEGILDLINSRTPTGAELALSALEGNTKNRLAELKAKLLSMLAEVEVDIDFSDQGLSVLDYEKWKRELRGWLKEVEVARKRFEVSKPLREGVRVALVGAPNAGKSTLFNALLGEDRSIVSDTAGTTRDVVRETFVLGDVLFRLSDTAGIRAAQDHIEAQGIERSLGEIKSSHLVLLVLDGSDSAQRREQYIEERIREIRRANPAARVLTILNKEDIAGGEQFPVGALVVSAKTRAGLDALSSRVQKEFLGDMEPGAGLEIGRARHFELLGRAAAGVSEAIEMVESGDAEPDLLSSSLRSAMANLGEITGEVTSEDVLNFIFSEFCIGK